MLKKTFAVVATLGLSVSIFGGSAYAQNSTQSKIESAQEQKAQEEYEAKEEVQLAAEVKDDSVENIEEQSEELTEEVADLSDEEYTRFIHNYVSENNESTEEMQEKLDLVGVEFVPEEDKGVQTMAIKDPSKISLSVYSTKRTGQNYWYLQTSWRSKEIEFDPATLDVVSLEWDPKYGKFYTAIAGGKGISTKRDGSKRDKGIYLFNVNDSKYNFDSYASVQVTKKKKGWLEYGAKYTHTYSTTKKLRLDKLA
ncbi:hypothetical protein F6Y05_36925 [Bacillus megaterium]|nr:hypothetical protein [Priestia megaterium]